ncbi:reverse transcriptase domain-containing protein [Tanacetum coccineum]
MLAQVSNRGNVGNQNGNVVNENVQENIGNVIVNGNQVGCSYKEFLACNPKEYDGKEGVVVLTRWIEKMESVYDMSGCSINQKVKYTAGSFVGKALTWWNSQIRTLSREVAISMSWNDFKFMMIQEFCPSHEMQKLESELWNHVMVGAGHAAYTDRFHELARLVPHLVTPESRMIERYVYGLAPQIRGMVASTEPKTIHKAVQISGELTDEAVRNGSIKKVKKRGNVGEPSKDKNGKDDNKRTMTVKLLLLLFHELARLVPHLVTPKSRMIKRYVYGLAPHIHGMVVATEPKTIQKAVQISGALTDEAMRNGSIKKVKKRGNVREPSKDKNGMDWLSNYKAEIVCNENVVGIPLPDGKVLKVLGERPDEKARFIMGIKKQEEIVVVREFPKVFPDDISGLLMKRLDELLKHDGKTYGLCERGLGFEVKIDDPNITMEEYIGLEEEKTRRHAIVFNDSLTSEVALLCEPIVSPLNDNEIDFRISYDESDDEDFTSSGDKDNDDDKVDIEHSSGDLSVKPLPDVINIDDGAYEQRYQYDVSWGMDMVYRLPV